MRCDAMPCHAMFIHNRHQRNTLEKQQRPAQPNDICDSSSIGRSTPSCQSRALLPVAGLGYKRVGTTELGMELCVSVRVCCWILPGGSALSRAWWLQRIWRRETIERRQHQSNSATLVRHTRPTILFAWLGSFCHATSAPLSPFFHGSL